MSAPRATKPLTIDADLYNDLVDHWVSTHPGMPGSEAERILGRLLMALEYDKCVDGDGSRMCETHDYERIEYYVDNEGKVLREGTFDPEETGYPICPQAQTYDPKKAREARRSS